MLTPICHFRLFSISVKFLILSWPHLGSLLEQVRSPSPLCWAQNCPRRSKTPPKKSPRPPMTPNMTQLVGGCLSTGRGCPGLLLRILRMSSERWGAARTADSSPGALSMRPGACAEYGVRGFVCLSVRVGGSQRVGRGGCDIWGHCPGKLLLDNLSQ